jgi:hypothetical protein
MLLGPCILLSNFLLRLQEKACSGEGVQPSQTETVLHDGDKRCPVGYCNCSNLQEYEPHR